MQPPVTVRRSRLNACSRPQMPWTQHSAAWEVHRILPAMVQARPAPVAQARPYLLESARQQQEAGTHWPWLHASAAAAGQRRRLRGQSRMAPGAGVWQCRKQSRLLAISTWMGGQQASGPPATQRSPLLSRWAMARQRRPVLRALSSCVCTPAASLPPGLAARRSRQPPCAAAAATTTGWPSRTQLW